MHGHLYVVCWLGLVIILLTSPYLEDTWSQEQHVTCIAQEYGWCCISHMVTHSIYYMRVKVMQCDTILQHDHVHVGVALDS